MVLSKQYYHSVTLDRDKCKGCINCIKSCPTEAIRVRDGKAKIIKERCFWKEQSTFFDTFILEEDRTPILFQVRRRVLEFKQL